MVARALRVQTLLVLAFALAVAVATSLSTSSAHATGGFAAHGSARQVYVTGLAPGVSASLVDGSGHTVTTQKADSLGGLLFREVTPGSGYRVSSGGTTSAPVTVHSEAAAPWDPSIYDQQIPADGYSYLTTRDGTQLAISVHPPTHPAGIGGLPEGFPVPSGPDYTKPYPTLIEYSGYGYADPDRSGERDRRRRQPDGLRRGRREHARHRLLRRRLRLLRAAAEPRRLRRHRDHRQPALGQGPQGRDDGHLLRRHQPALHRPAAPAAPRRDRADVGDRRDGHDALPRRRPQHRLRRRLGQGAPGRGTAAGTGATGTQAYAEKQVAAGDQTCRATRRCTARPTT